jgi:hypothetical protein
MEGSLDGFPENSLVRLGCRRNHPACHVVAEARKPGA